VTQRCHHLDISTVFARAAILEEFGDGAEFQPDVLRELLPTPQPRHRASSFMISQITPMGRAPRALPDPSRLPYGGALQHAARLARQGENMPRCTRSSGVAVIGHDRIVFAVGRADSTANAVSCITLTGNRFENLAFCLTMRSMPSCCQPSLVVGSKSNPRRASP